MWLLQLSDLHVTAPGRLLWGVLDTAARLELVLESVHREGPRPDLLLVTGDLVGEEEPVAYAWLAERLERLGVPILPLAGNHDDRTRLEAAFPEVPGRIRLGERRPIAWCAGPFWLIGLDTLVPGRLEGRIGDEQRAWLAARLAAADRPVVLALHHAPVPIGMPYMDRRGLEDAAELGEIVRAFRDRILAILAGHLHRLAFAHLAGVPVVVAPSTAFTAAPSMLVREAPARFLADPPAFCWHRYDPAQGLVTLPASAGFHPPIPRRRQAPAANGGDPERAGGAPKTPPA